MAGKVLDLSVTVDENTKSPPSTDLRVELRQYRRGPGHWQVTAVSQSLHTGSHIDAPLHCFEDGGTTEEIPLDRVVGEAFVLDCSQVEPEQGILARDLDGVGSDLREGDIAIIRTDWTDRSWGSFPDFYTRSPYLGTDAAEWLVARRPKAIGFDFFEEYSARLPEFSSEDFVCHRIMLGAGIPLLEQITRLGSVGRNRFDFFAPFYKIAGSDGAPARFFAVVD